MDSEKYKWVIGLTLGQMRTCLIVGEFILDNSNKINSL